MAIVVGYSTIVKWYDYSEERMSPQSGRAKIHPHPTVLLG
jgi:hypothetical protein